MAASQEQHRYLVHFADGGAGIRMFDAHPVIGDELTDGGTAYQLTRIERRDGTSGFGHAWAEPVQRGD